MLTFEQIKDLIDQVAKHRLSCVELERSGFRLKIDGHRITSAQAGPAAAPVTGHADEAPAAHSAATPAAPAAPAATPEPAAPVDAEATDSLPPDAHILKSPIVGTFYHAPNPDSPPFVEVGDRVESGQVLCIVEAMKLMNEIESDVDGTILEIFVANAQAVEYGEPLFAIKAGK